MKIYNFLRDYVKITKTEQLIFEIMKTKEEYDE